MKLGNANVNKIRLGSTQMKRVYLGSNIVWQNAPTAIAATGVGTTSFTAEWEAYSGAVVYYLDVSETSDFSTFVYENQIVEAPATSYVVIGLNSNTTYYYRVRASDDADSLAFFNRVANVGGTLTSTEQIAIIDLVQDLKDYGIWTKMKAVYPMVGASAAACAQNLKSSSFTGTFTSGWTYASTGVTPNGTSAYMNTNIVLQTDLFGKDSSISYYSRTDSNGLKADIGSFGNLAVNSISMYTRLNNEFYLDYPIETSRITVSNTNSLGMYNANNSSSVGRTLFKNGAKIINSSFSNNDFPVNTNPNLIIGSSYSGGRSSDRQIAFASMGSALTDTEASNYYTAVQAFQTTLSRNV